MRVGIWATVSAAMVWGVVGCGGGAHPPGGTGSQQVADAGDSGGPHPSGVDAGSTGSGVSDAGLPDAGLDGGPGAGLDGGVDGGVGAQDGGTADGGLDGGAGTPDGGVACVEGFTPLAPFTTTRDAPGMAPLPDGRVLAAGGFDPAWSKTARSSAELYDPATDTWTATASMSVERSSPFLVELLDGRALVVGGYSSVGTGPNVPHRLTELYDPNANTWTPAAKTQVPRESVAEYTLLTDGRVLLHQRTGDTTPGTEAEIYDPTKDEWTFTGPVPVETYPGGLFAIPGGDAIAVTDGAPVLRFDGATNTWSDTHADSPSDFTGPRQVASLGGQRVLVWSRDQTSSAVLDLGSLQWTSGPTIPATGVMPLGTLGSSLVLVSTYNDSAQTQSTWIVSGNPLSVRSGPVWSGAPSLIAKDAVDLGGGRLLVVTGTGSSILQVCDR